MINCILTMNDLGQRVWLDSFSASQLSSGALSTYIHDNAITGLTTNPAILHKALSTDTTYQDRLKALAHKNLNAAEKLEQVVIPDIQAACDLLRPIYEQSHKETGYVSLEVSPLLAHDALQTVAEATRLWQLVNRPNIMIKVPGTNAGNEALSTLINEGINVNVTLSFSIAQLEATWLSYTHGLKQRLTAGLPLQHIKAVASFFLSRTDHLLDPMLPAELQGKTAITLAKIAYIRYLEFFHGLDFAELAKAGANPQCLLWASTSTKNKAFPDTLYVEELLAPNTITTLPQTVVEATLDHADIHPMVLESPDSLLATQTHISSYTPKLSDIGEQLQKEGLQLFCNEYNQTLEFIQKPLTS